MVKNNNNSKNRRSVTSLPVDGTYQGLLDRICGGEFSRGDLLPSERVMITTYNVSRPTLRKALSRLHRDGLVVCMPGVGHKIIAIKRPLEFKDSPKIIGLIVSSSSDLQTSGIQILEKHFAEIGYSVLLGVSDLLVEQENDCIERFRKIGVHGFVVIPAIYGEEHSHLGDLIREGFPIVAIGEPRAWCIGEQLSHTVSIVGTDNAATMSMALAKLYDQGHRCIGNFDEVSMRDVSTIQQYTFERLIKERGLKSKDDWTLYIDPANPSSGRDACEKLFKGGEAQPTAMICHGSDVARHAIHLLTLYNIRVPDDISLISFGASESEVGTLTRVCYSGGEYAREVVKAIVEQIDGSAVRKKTLLLPRLIEGTSTCRSL